MYSMCSRSEFLLDDFSIRLLMVLTERKLLLVQQLCVIVCDASLSGVCVGCADNAAD